MRCGLKRALLLLFLGVSLVIGAAAVHAGGIRRAILITVDGLRYDVVTDDSMPTCARLLREGAATLDAESLEPTFTIPNHVSMCTGLTPQTHGVLEISDPGDFVVDGTIFELAKDAGRTTGIYVSKRQLRLLAKPGTFDRFVATDNGSSEAVVASLIADLDGEATRWDLILLHLTEPDFVGHATGWLSVRYLESLATVDAFVARVLDALHRSGLSQETLLVITSDHGGSGTSHAEPIPEVTRIPWIAVGPGVPRAHEIRRRVGTHDTAPTLLRALGLEVPETMEGTAVLDVIPGAVTEFLRGDPDVDGAITLADGVHVLFYLFRGRSIRCAGAGDMDLDGRLTLSDPVYLLSHLFRGGEAPPPPHPHCGLPPEPAPLSCFAPCP
jgi:hypothetical protein